MKHFCYVILLAFVSSNLESQQHNFYLGVNAGISWLSAKRDDSTLNHSPFYKELANQKNVTAKSAVAGVFIGYLFRFENFGMGTELFAEYQNFEKTIEEKYVDTALFGDENSLQLKYKLTGPTGINIKIGYFLSDNFLYALLGWQQQKIRYQANLTNAPVANVVSQHAQTKGDYIKGHNFGLGVQRPINENYTMGFEFKMTKIPKRDFAIDFKDAFETKLSSKLTGIRIYSASLRFMYTF